MPDSADDFSYAPFVEKRGNLIVGAGLMAFPVLWGILVWGQLAYFGPMRSLFTKITRRYLDTLPFGWAFSTFSSTFFHWLGPPSSRLASS